jgi:hypothetical protein
MRFEIPYTLAHCPHCPPNAPPDDIYEVGTSFWCLCRTHRTRWLAGWDDSIADDKAEQQRHYNELGIGEFEHVGKEEVEMLMRIDNPNPPLVLPAFAFGRRHDIEIECGFILAGSLVIDVPKDAEPGEHDLRMVREIVQELTAAARSGKLPENAVAYGWRYGRKPDNAADEATIDRWAETRHSIAVRVDPRNDGMVRIDSDIALQLGLTKRQ